MGTQIIEKKMHVGPKRTVGKGWCVSILSHSPPFFFNNERRKMPDTADDQISAKGV